MDESKTQPWRMEPNALGALRLQQARTALEDGDPHSAIVEAEELLDEAPDNLDALFLVGDACLELGDAAGAHAAFLRYLELAPEDAGALSGLAVACFDLTDFEGCIEYARQATTLETELAEAWYYLGLAQERLGRDREARRAFARAEKLDPESWPLLKPLSQAEWNVVLGRALQLLPPALKAWFDHVRLDVQALPDLDDLREAQPPLPPTVPALYIGEPPDHSPDPWQTHPDCVKVYRTNVERAALWSGDLPRTLAEALRAEALDWLGQPPDAHPLRA